MHRPEEEDRISLAVLLVRNIVDRVADYRLGAIDSFNAQIPAHLAEIGADALGRIFIPGGEHLTEQAFRIGHADQTTLLGCERGQDLGIPAAIAGKDLSDRHVRLNSEKGQCVQRITPFITAPVLIPAFVVDDCFQTGVSRHVLCSKNCIIGVSRQNQRRGAHRNYRSH